MNMNKNNLKVKMYREKAMRLWFIIAKDVGYLHHDGKLHRSTGTNENVGKPIVETWAGYWQNEDDAKAFLASMPDEIEVVSRMPKTSDYWPEPEDDIQSDDILDF